MKRGIRIEMRKRKENKIIRMKRKVKRADQRKQRKGDEKIQIEKT